LLGAVELLCPVNNFPGTINIYKPQQFSHLVAVYSLEGMSRLCLVSAVALGTSSVLIDIFTAGVLWEECFKLLAELLVTCALLKSAEDHFHQ
jgi:hypothetical protein